MYNTHHNLHQWVQKTSKLPQIGLYFPVWPRYTKRCTRLLYKDNLYVMLVKVLIQSGRSCGSAYQETCKIITRVQKETKPMSSFCIVFLFKFLPDGFTISIPDISFNNECSFLTCRLNTIIVVNDYWNSLVVQGWKSCIRVTTILKWLKLWV
jgi:hypothetical protein